MHSGLPFLFIVKFVINTFDRYQPLLFNQTDGTCPFAKEPFQQCPYPTELMPWNAPFGIVSFVLLLGICFFLSNSFVQFDNNMAHSIFQGHSMCQDSGTGAGSQSYPPGHGALYKNFKVCLHKIF